MDLQHFIQKNKIYFFTIFILYITIFVFRINPSNEFLIKKPELVLEKAIHDKNSSLFKKVFFHYWYGLNDRKKAYTTLKKGKEITSETILFYNKWILRYHLENNKSMNLNTK